MHIPLEYEHLFYKYYVRQSVGQATKGKRASLLVDVVILVYKIEKLMSCNFRLITKNLLEIISLLKLSHL